MNSNRLTIIVLILFALIMSTFYFDCKSQNSENDNLTKTNIIWKDCKINKITKIINGYVIDAEDAELKFKIASPQSYSLIKFRRDFNIKHIRDTVQIGKIYKFKLEKLFPHSENFIYGVRVTAIIYKDCAFELEFGANYFTTECLEGLEIINEMCK